MPDLTTSGVAGQISDDVTLYLMHMTEQQDRSTTHGK